MSFRASSVHVTTVDIAWAAMQRAPPHSAAVRLPLLLPHRLQPQHSCLRRRCRLAAVRTSAQLSAMPQPHSSAGAATTAATAAAAAAALVALRSPLGAAAAAGLRAYIDPHVLGATLGASFKLVLVVTAMAWLLRTGRLPNSTATVLSKASGGCCLPAAGCQADREPTIPLSRSPTTCSSRPCCSAGCPRRWRARPTPARWPSSPPSRWRRS